MILPSKLSLSAQTHFLCMKLFLRWCFSKVQNRTNVKPPFLFFKNCHFFPGFFSLNPFLTNVPLLYPLKTPENHWFSGVFRGYKIGTLARNRSKYQIANFGKTLSSLNKDFGQFECPGRKNILCLIIPPSFIKIY